MISIDQNKCIGCGRCVKECFPGNIGMAEGKAIDLGGNCMTCGHCLAVCPVGAVTLPVYDMNEVLEIKGLNQAIDPEVYLNHLKARRSIRQFTKAQVDKKAVEMILEAGRFSPTGGNLQNVAYYVAMDTVEELKGKLISELKDMGQAAKAAGSSVSWYSDAWLKMAAAYEKDGSDSLFFNAPCVIVISSDSPQSAIIAAAHMETMVYSLGLGMLYSGFTNRAIEHSPELQKYLGIKEGYKAYAILVIGHPDVKFERTVPRKKADVIWH